MRLSFPATPPGLRFQGAHIDPSIRNAGVTPDEQAHLDHLAQHLQQPFDTLDVLGIRVSLRGPDSPNANATSPHGLVIEVEDQHQSDAAGQPRVSREPVAMKGSFNPAELISAMFTLGMTALDQRARTPGLRPPRPVSLDRLRDALRRDLKLQQRAPLVGPTGEPLSPPPASPDPSPPETDHPTPPASGTFQLRLACFDDEDASSPAPGQPDTPLAPPADPTPPASQR